MHLPVRQASPYLIRVTPGHHPQAGRRLQGHPGAIPARVTDLLRVCLTPQPFLDGLQLDGLQQVNNIILARRAYFLITVTCGRFVAFKPGWRGSGLSFPQTNFENIGQAHPGSLLQPLQLIVESKVNPDGHCRV